MAMGNKIVFSAAVVSVKTLADGGIRIAFDLPENAIDKAAMLMECKRQGVPLLVSAEADEPKVVSNKADLFSDVFDWKKIANLE